MKNTVASLMGMKEKGEKISMLTCYDYSTAKIMEEAGVNSILWEILLVIPYSDIPTLFQ